MKASLLATTAITTTAISMSIYFASLDNPTDLQRQLSTTTNTIAVAGTTAVFGLLDKDIDDETPNS